MIEILVAIAAKLSPSERVNLFDDLVMARHVTRYAAVRVGVTQAIATLREIDEQLDWAEEGTTIPASQAGARVST
jgi:hypothetical protein